MILVDAYPRHDWLLEAVDKRLREELAKLRVEINEEKSRVVDLARGELRVPGLRVPPRPQPAGVWRPHYTPKLKKRTALLRKLKEIFRRLQSQPIERVVSLINPILRGWVNYFAVGHSSRCFGFVSDWVEKKMRRHLAHAQKRQGFGWEGGVGRGCTTRWGCSTATGCAATGRKRPGMIGPITLGVKRTGARSAGNPHAAFDVAGAGNVARSGQLRPTGAPVLDPTDERRRETEQRSEPMRHRQDESRRKTATLATYRHRASRRLYCWCRAGHDRR